jgi:hypothetical protein
MTVFVYLTAPTGTVHLADQLATGTTRCGRVTGPDWEEGDETLSGFVATCQRCKTSAVRSRS